MRILLLGEFSALHSNLKAGLEGLGHEVVLAGTGDGFKKTPVDFDFDSSLPSALGKIHKYLKPFFHLDEFSGFDVVQVINPFIFYSPRYPSAFNLAYNKILFNEIRQRNGKMFLLGAGSDAYFWRVTRDKMRYSPHSEHLKYDLKTNYHYLESDGAFELNNYFVELVDGIIPIMYEYEVAYQDCPKRLNTIAIPMNLDKIKFVENKVEDKITVFHGLNRYGFKGTLHVETAFRELSERYQSDLELVIRGNMPLNDYLELMKKTNIVVDQVNSYSLGVNGIYALAMGKVVMGGAEPESLISLGIERSPVINLLPDAKDIMMKITELLDRKAEISELALESRLFVEKHHSHVKVAQKYLDTWALT